MVRSHHRTGPITAAMAILVLSGAMQDLQLVFRAGYAFTEDKDFPNWYPDSEFRATREATLAQPAEFN